METNNTDLVSISRFMMTTTELKKTFDPNRAILSKKSRFRPFRVKRTRPLREALANGDVTSDTELLVMVRNDVALALSTMQMAYHHVAQGEIAGEPWLVTF